jgi:hypothetical protein
MSETHKRQGGPIKDYIIPVQPNIVAIDTTEKQVVDLLNHAVNTMHMSRYQ